MKKVFEEAKIEKIILSVADIVTASGNLSDGFNVTGNEGQGWDDIDGSKA